MAAMANTALLLPVTESAAQLHAIRRIQSGAAQALYERGEDFDQALSLGVCPTTQSALQNARALLEDADLLLIDTDAISRTVTGVTSISQLIEDAVESARALNRFVLFKGEPANDPRALSHLAAMGVHAVVDPFCDPVERINKIHAKTSCK
jgi:phosphoenolpyruvate-protein kinase (PTS system EI component)